MKIITFIPILNPEKYFFEDLIPKLKEQTLSTHIVVINSGDAAIESGDFEVINIEKKDFNHANTRNIALKFDGDFYLFMTQDATPFDDKLIESLIRPFKDEDLAVSYARQIPYKDAYVTEVFARNFNYPPNSIIKSKNDIKTLGIKTYFTSNSCSMYKAEYFKKAGGFKKDLNMSEDMEFAARAIRDDKKIAYEADAKVYHSHRYTVKSLYERYIQIGKFFGQNPWIEESIKEFGSTQKSGKKFVLEEFFYILKNRPSALIISVLFTAAKYLGYKRGKNSIKKIT